MSLLVQSDTAADAKTVSGLTSAEAARLRSQFGRNELERDNTFLPFKLLLGQFASPLVLVLLVASGVALAAGLQKDAYLILGILLLNAILGFWQEFKAEKAVLALKNLTVAKTRVIRDGREVELPNSSLVPGDLVVIFEGQTVPADCLLLEGFSVEVNESALTGESLPVTKLGGDKENSLLYMGTVVTSGNGRAVVQTIGMQTRFGRIAEELKSVKNEPTPFQKSIAKLSKFLAVLAVVAAVVVYLAGVVQGLPVFEVFLVAASLAVAAVPEGLPAIVGLSLAVGVQRMARKKAIMRKMSAVEALGAVTVICTDKTGTLTSGQMRVRYLWAAGSSHAVSSLRGRSLSEPMNKLLEVAVLDNTSTLVVKEDSPSGYDMLGTPTDGSMLLAAAELGQYEEIKSRGKVIQDFPLDKTLKLISSFCQVEGQFRGFVRGAPERVLAISRTWQTANGVEALSDDKRAEIKQAFEDYAARGFRVVACAYKNMGGGSLHDFLDLKRSDIEENTTFAGFVAIADPPRPEVKAALAKAKRAGIATIMLTGDNLLTAKAIGHEIGMLSPGDQVVLGEQISKLTDAELDAFIDKVRIVARAAPEQKLRVIQSLQRQGQVVAVTGDGVNDSLALKQADVGIAMGIVGTDVAKQASDIILADDKYSTIVTAVEEGRRIDDNLTKVVRYLVAGNFSEVLTVFVAVVGGFTTPLLPVQILWVNIVTDALPAFALAVGDGDNRAMQRKPKDKNYHPLNKQGIQRVSIAAFIIAALTLTAFFSFLSHGEDVARTMAFTVLIVSQLIMAAVIAYLHRGHVFNWHSNRYLLLAILLTVAVQMLFLVFPPLRETFHLKLPN